MKKVVVAGGAGYIGSHTVIKLCELGYEPIMLSPNDFITLVNKSNNIKIKW